MSKTTRESYARSVRMLIEHFEKPRRRAEAERQAVFLKEAYHIPRQVKMFHDAVFLTTAYSSGQRLQEALFLEVSDIDSPK